MVVLGIDAREHAPLAEQTAKARQFRDKHDLTYPILVDAGDQVVEQYRVFGFPTSVIIDRQGVVHEVEAGADPTLPQKIAALLAAPKNARQ